MVALSFYCHATCYSIFAAWLSIELCYLFLKLSFNITGPFFIMNTLSVCFYRSELHCWSLLNSVVRSIYHWLKHIVKTIEYLRNTTQFILSLLIAVFNEPNEIALLTVFARRISPFCRLFKVGSHSSKNLSNGISISESLTRQISLIVNFFSARCVG